MISRTGMQKYLRDSFARNKPYDQMVHELVTATGGTSPDADDFNGATNFLIEKVNDENGAQATAATSRIFLGLQVQCTQCHNHPFNEWKQKKYWELNAFFRQTRARRADMTMQDAAASLVDRDFRGESNNVDEADLFFEERNGYMRVAYPVFIDGTSINPDGKVSVVNRRKELSRLMLESDYLEKAMVNRMWGHFLGYGFTKPVDDLGPHNSASHPELLDYLAGQFRDTEFNIRRLIEWIVLSRPYSLSSRGRRTNQSDDPLMGETPKFSRFYLRQMRAEELYESLLVATQAHRTSGNYEQQEQEKNRWLQQFSVAFGTDEGDETTTFNGTIPQILMMFNGEMIQKATNGEKGSLLHELAVNDSIKGSDKIHRLFLAGLARRGSSNELQMAQEILKMRNGNIKEALQDIWWTILNSNEFVFNH